ncbi:SSI family serine proteinase inhibitor [Modestobacter sp. VKM Ac-2979]|uniref:SSI family serine proteinase inhibitor n=1 Tax=unclassified Modestobacter TaxID=2643866 RepID=UPI0022AB8B5F|nr:MULTISPECIES: SSI family serine proteinase inhibitor [unclassified Modestobacter]MCZ2812807.1 SSI family serine proteinase inhibitor [Modestobacter sp. VKM Ac-2979]MCZ2843164.1 SSI family serine proteinase inhibitor [Modestobacter sp. VKM Ac-2980]
MRRVVLSSLVVPLMLLAACGTGDDNGTAAGSSTPPPTSPAAGPTASDPATDPGSGGIGSADNDLVIEYDPGDGAPVERYTLTCVGSVEGDLPDAEAACQHLESLEEPFAPVPDDAMCTQQFGGPQTAHVTGLWRGDPVDLQLSRTDGCRISQWDRLGPLLPGPAR